MSCNEISKSISDYLDGELSGHELLEFEIHVEKCTKCSEELESFSKMLACLKKLKIERSPVNCWAGVNEGICRQREERRPWYRFFGRPLVFAPGLAAAVIAVVIFAFSSSPEPSASSCPISNPEYCSYVSAHSRAQRAESMSDPDVAFVAAELEKASLK